jgi:hypothetical protein
MRAGQWDENEKGGATLVSNVSVRLKLDVGN